MTKKALLVGINYPGTSHALRGCVNDVMLMSQVLSKRFGFKSRDKRMLTDASATTHNILQRLRWLVKGAQPGDVLYFHFSGHGSQMVDQKYDQDYEPDGLDEIICPVDLDWRTRVIRDDDLKMIFNQVPEGVNLTAVLDCCHSGGGADHLYQYQPTGVAAVDHDPFSPNKSRLLPMPADIANRAIGLDIKPRSRGVSLGGGRTTGLLISGCQSHQTSADAWIHNKYQGAATFFLNHELQKARYNLDYETLVERMNQKLEQYGYTQRPELNGASDLFSKKFLEPWA